MPYRLSGVWQVCHLGVGVQGFRLRVRILVLGFHDNCYQAVTAREDDLL